LRLEADKYCTITPLTTMTVYLQNESPRDKDSFSVAEHDETLSDGQDKMVEDPDFDPATVDERQL